MSSTTSNCIELQHLKKYFNTKKRTATCSRRHQHKKLKKEQHWEWLENQVVESLLWDEQL